MAGISVTIDSLNNVKRALSDFQTDIESISDKINSDKDQVLAEVQKSVKRQLDIATLLADKVSVLIKEAEQIQTDINSVNSKISTLKTVIVNFESEKSQLEARLPQLEKRKRQLESQKNSTPGDANGIESQIRSIENQIQNCRRSLSEVNEKISSAKKQLADHEVRLAELKENKKRKLDEVISARNELGKAKNKYERLSDAGDSVEREIINLNVATGKFKQTSLTSSAASKTGINKCIAIIEEYLAINLGAGASGGGTSGGSYGEGGGTANYSSSDSGTVSQERSYPYSNSEEMPDNVYNSIRGYQENPEWNSIIRSGDTTSEIDNFRNLINDNHLSESAHFTRKASLADLGPELQNLPLEELAGQSYSFVGIMSASGTQEMADSVSAGNVIYEITAPAGTAALDLTNLPDFQEVMFDSPTCHIESAEMCGYNTIRVNITVG